MAAKKTKSKSARKPAAKKAPKVAKKRGKRRAKKRHAPRRQRSSARRAPAHDWTVEPTRRTRAARARFKADLTGEHMDNQTKDAWISQYATSLGTGIFLIPDVESDDEFATRKLFVQDLSYTDCVRRGARAMAFKWVPEPVAAYLSLKSSTCGGVPCVDRCVADGCLCNRATGKCQ